MGTDIYAYDAAFLKYAAQSSVYSAGKVTALLCVRLEVGSVLDVGCGVGTWLRAWAQCGVADCHGVDGAYVDGQSLEIPATKFTAIDLNAPFDLRRKFDLVQSLEVGEHVESDSVEAFVDSLARHASRYILFSAAPPGQGGEFHINEQPYDFWREKLERRGFSVVDAVRPMIMDDARISYWYRYNTFLFVRRELLAGFPGLQCDAVSESAPLADVSPLVFRFRKAFIRMLPYGLQHEIARLKARVLPTGRI